jgi:hypothetical protein
MKIRTSLIKRAVGGALGRSVALARDRPLTKHSGGMHFELRETQKDAEHAQRKAPRRDP